MDNKSLHHKKVNLLREVLSQGIKTSLICVLLLSSYFVFNQSNFLGFLNFGETFEPFSKIDNNIKFSECYKFLDEAPLENDSTLLKWNVPLKVRYEGAFDQEDEKVLHKIAERFNSIEGFPGIEFVEKNENVLVSYVLPTEYEKYAKRYDHENNNNSFCKYYSLDGEINKSAIVIYNELWPQGYKNSTVLHEFFHLVGFVGHTDMKDSIINRIGPVSRLSPIDVLSFKMIYNPDIKVNSTYSEIEYYYSDKEITPFLSNPDESLPGKNMPSMTIPLVVVGTFLLMQFLFMLKRLGFLSASLITCVCILICWVFYYTFGIFDVWFK
jgi:hypothetical protein